MKYLIVAAHPDDEVLGAGATIHKAAVHGEEVYVCLLSHWSPTRDDNLEDGIASSHAILGVKKSYVGDFGCMRFKDEDHHAIVRFIESAIKDCQPDILITHHPADVHIDHGITSECCIEASRLPMRQIESIPAIRCIMFMEVPSSTDWNISTSNGVFVPNVFVSVDNEDISVKIEAIGVYKDVVRKVPHPRSSTAVNALATLRGSQSGTRMAESFQLVFGLGGVGDMMVTIHQPCYLPYLGVFHKIWKADAFVFLDDAQYSNGYVFEWNRIKTPQGECRLKVPLDKKFGQTLLEVVPKYSLGWQSRHIKTVEMNYKRAPYFAELFPAYKEIVSRCYISLVHLNVELMNFFIRWFGWHGEKVFYTSDWSLESRSEARVIEICKRLGADAYLSGTGGRNYQEDAHFLENGIKLVYQEWEPEEYRQLWGDFLPYMSILDYAMNEGHDIDSHFRKMEEAIADGKE